MSAKTARYSNGGRSIVIVGPASRARERGDGNGAARRGPRTQRVTASGSAPPKNRGNSKRR